jgi:hypothetical protein
MFSNYKDIIIVLLLFFLFRKNKDCSNVSNSENLDENIDTAVNTNSSSTASQDIINEFTERAYENAPELMLNAVYGNGIQAQK